MDYDEQMEKIAEEYGPKALALLSRIRDALIAEGFEGTEPFDMSADDYRWSMLITRPGQPQDQGVDISVEIAEQRDYDDDEGWGLNFALDIVQYGGIILGGLTPYNYSELCWVDSRDAEMVANRWAILEQAEIAEVPPLVAQGTDRERTDA
jgi:hypothetical protein